MTLEADAACQGCGSIDAGSYDPDGEDDVASLTEDPGCPYELGDTAVTLTIEDLAGESDSCGATVTVVDVTAPEVACNAPATITPPDAPISFTATVDDNCGADLKIVGYDCWAINGAGKRISKLESCVVFYDSDTVTIEDSGGVGDHIDWMVVATDGSGNVTEVTCSIEVVKPGRGPKK